MLIPVNDKPGFNRIVYAVTASEHSLAALPFVVDIASASEAQVLVLHVWSPDDPNPGHGSRRLAVIEIEELLQHVLRQLRMAGVTAVGESPAAVSDRVPYLINGRADSFRADLVVVGNRGPSDLHNIFGASRTHQLASMSNRPVLAVGTAARRWLGKLRRVLVTLDDGGGRSSVVSAAIDIAAPAAASVDVIHFCGGSQSQLGVLADDLASSGLRISWIRGDAGRNPADQIVQASIRRESDLVIVASDRTSSDTLLPGDVMHRLLGTAPCAVLVVPPVAGPNGSRRLTPYPDEFAGRSA